MGAQQLHMLLPPHVSSWPNEFMFKINTKSLNVQI